MASVPVARHRPALALLIVVCVIVLGLYWWLAAYVVSMAPDSIEGEATHGAQNVQKENDGEAGR